MGEKQEMVMVEKSYLEWVGREITDIRQRLAEKDKEIEQLRDALTEQLDRRGWAFRGRCDNVPEDIERAFNAMGICTEEHKVFLAEQEKG